MIVVNTHLYGLNVASGGAILPEHDVVVFDEAHVLEDVMSDTVGVEIAPGRFTTLAGRSADSSTIRSSIGSVAEIAEALRDALAPHVGNRLTIAAARLGPGGADRRPAAARQGRTRSLVGIETTVEEAKQRKLRAQTMTGRAIEQLDVAIEGREGYVAFVSGSRELAAARESRRSTSARRWQEGVWSQRTAVLTSATIPSSLASRVGIAAGRQVDVADVGSPFDYEAHSMLYCAMHMPNPNSDGVPRRRSRRTRSVDHRRGRAHARAVHQLAIDGRGRRGAARPRATSRSSRSATCPSRRSIKAFADSDETCLFATAGLFQGVDVPGQTLSLVVIDRIPFPRPDDPLLVARREQLGPTAFAEIDIPRASMMLAQACGRLIRSPTDRGVVAVMDPRLGTARYRWDIVKALPPMKRTRHRADVEAFLRDITADPT